MKAVVLAAGRGTRMRAVRDVVLEPEQERMAALGAKAVIPIHGRPFLSWTLAAMADAGVRDVCIVVPPADVLIRGAFDNAVTRLRISFATQHDPRGSAHALLAAEDFAGDDPFVLVNSDNVYPAAAFELLRRMPGSGLVAFRRDTLIARSNIGAERIAGYALVHAEHGVLRDIIEKPDADALPRAGPRALVSMTCWRFGPTIFDACRAIPASARGELELPDAVLHLVRGRGERFDVAVSDEGVADLSVRDDVATVAALLRDVPVRL